MSIYASRFTYGEDEPGEVLSYLGSHLYPNQDRDGEAHISLASIPPWCVPGHGDNTDEHGHTSGEYLRLTLTTLHHDAAAKWKTPMIGPGGDVTLTRQAARALAAALTEWANEDETKPDTPA